jgi:hypothetical protein
MSASTKLVDKLEGVENFHAWKYRIGLILEENDLARFIQEDVPKPANAAAKAKHQKDTVRAKRIIANSIKDHLIPQVSSKKTPKEMFDALTRALATHTKGGRKKLIRSLNPKTNSYIKNLNQGDSRSFKKDKEEKKISYPTNVTIVTRWDIL